jgi:hypothetical protein
MFLLAGCLLSPEELEAQPFATWSEQNVERIIVVDDRKPVRLTLTATESIPETTLDVTPGLESWVTYIAPRELPALSSGDEVTIDIVLTAPWLGTEDGTLKLRERGRSRGRGRVYSRPLALSVEGVATIEETLPPPEPEGLFAFTDSDRDGLPDDAQRSIELGPFSRAEKEALRQLAAAEMLAFSEESWPETWAAMDKALSCAYSFIRTGDLLEKRYPVILALEGGGNSLERERMYVRFDGTTPPDWPLMEDSPQSCDFPLGRL